MRTTQGFTIKAFLRSAEIEQAVRGALADVPEIRLEVIRESLQAHTGRLAAPTASDLLLVDIDLGDREQLLALRHVVRNRPAGAGVVVTSGNASVEALRQLMRLKIADYLPQPFTQGDLVSVVEGALKQLRAADAPAQGHCAVFSFIKPTGGMGATSLAIQTAFELAGRAKRVAAPRVCLVDLDFQCGNAALYLDLEPGLNIAEIARAPQRLDAQLLQSMTASHGGGVDLLAAPNELIELEAVTPDAVRRLLEVTCERYDHVVIDLPQAWTRWSGDVLAGSDVVVMVLQLTVAAVKQGRQLLDRLRAKESADLPVEIVLNRYQRTFWRSGLRFAEAERALDRRIGHRIANDYRLVSEALNRGVPLTQIRRRGKIQKQVRKMVAAFSDRPARATPPKTKVVELLTASR